MGVKNKAVAGDYRGEITSSLGGRLSIVYGFLKTIDLSKDTIIEYEVVDESKRKSAASAVGKGLVGGLAGTLLLGPIGLVGGLAGLAAKSKGTHIVAVQFKDGKKSLLQLNDKFYSMFIKRMF